jgi:hypothetical protein
VDVECESIFLLLALMALARIPSLEALRFVVPGECGKLIGLDRIPEVRTLRQKISELCSEEGLAERWSNALAKQWMAEEPEYSVLYELVRRLLCKRDEIHNDSYRREDSGGAHCARSCT